MPSEAALELWRTITEMLDTASDSAIVEIIDRAIQQAVQADRERAAALRIIDAMRRAVRDEAAAIQGGR